MAENRFSDCSDNSCNPYISLGQTLEGPTNLQTQVYGNCGDRTQTSTQTLYQVQDPRTGQLVYLDQQGLQNYIADRQQDYQQQVLQQ
ncbi:MAG: hypothetical protein K2Z81_00135, partial [Cyanobacteria bacterium]|nr:hypothetical protein [Cyanobacteriota bacterium]